MVHKTASYTGRPSNNVIKYSEVTPFLDLTPIDWNVAFNQRLMQSIATVG